MVLPSLQKTNFFTKYVLLVEDNPINQMVAVNFLKGCGITKIRVENNGKKGFEAYKEKQPDIILMVRGFLIFFFLWLYASNFL